MYDSAFPVWEYTQRKLNWNVKEMSVLLCLLKDYSQELRIKTKPASQFSEWVMTLATKPDNPNFNPWDLRGGGRREPTPAICALICTQVSWSDPPCKYR